MLVQHYGYVDVLETLVLIDYTPSASVLMDYLATGADIVTLDTNVVLDARHERRPSVACRTHPTNHHARLSVPHLCILALVSHVVQLQAEPFVYRETDLQWTHQTHHACHTLASTLERTSHARKSSFRPSRESMLVKLDQPKTLVIYTSGREFWLRWD